MAVPDNILWAFFSPDTYENYQYDNKFPVDVYYKNIKGEWVLTTHTFQCIETARKTFHNAGVKYLGPVLLETRTDVPRGSVFPPKPEEKTDFKNAKGIRIKSLPASDYWVYISKHNKSYSGYDPYDHYDY